MLNAQIEENLLGSDTVDICLLENKWNMLKFHNSKKSRPDAGQALILISVKASLFQ